MVVGAGSGWWGREMMVGGGASRPSLRLLLSIPSHGLSRGEGPVQQHHPRLPCWTLAPASAWLARLDTHTISAVPCATSAVCLVYLPYRSARLATFTCRYYYSYILDCPPVPFSCVGSPDDCCRWNGCRNLVSSHGGHWRCNA